MEGRNRRFAVAMVTLAAVCAALPAPAAFPGANGKIAFTRYFFDAQVPYTQIHVMDADGGNQTRLTNNTNSDQSPVWSPDGTRIAFSRFVDGFADIVVMLADGTGQTNITNSPGVHELQPAWSPDGTKIAFRSHDSGNYDVQVMNADGSGRTNLTNAAGSDERPAWSPDGTKIAFQSQRDGNYEVYVMNADGTAQTNLTNDGSANDVEPDWSPDGTRIAFRSRTPGRDDLIVMNPDGTGAVSLVHVLGGVLATPVWSPDGTRIAYHGNSQIQVINADGTGASNVSNNSALDSDPDWQPLVDSCPTAVELSVIASAGNPTALQVDGSDGDVDTLTLSAQVSGAAPDLCAVTGMTVTLSGVVGGGTFTQPATADGCSGGVLTLSATFASIPVNVYDVSFAFDECLDVSGGTSAVLGVFDPALGFTTGGGTIDRGGVLANFGMNAKYQKKGRPQGSLLYIEHRADGEAKFKGNQVDSVAIVGSTAVVLGKGILNGAGNHSFRATVADNGKGGSSDSFGLQVWSPSGVQVLDMSFAPETLTGGNVTVPHGGK